VPEVVAMLGGRARKSLSLPGVAARLSWAVTVAGIRMKMRIP
jgi:hypothetical protein